MSQKSNSNDPECHVMYFRGVSRLHEETMDLFRLHVPKIEGTANGAHFGTMMKLFLHHDVVGAISWITPQVVGSELFEKADKCLRSYIDTLPESENECCLICYSLLSREERDSILVSSIPEGVTKSLKTLSGGRWLIERLEAKLWTVVNSRS